MSVAEQSQRTKTRNGIFTSGYSLKILIAGLLIFGLAAGAVSVRADSISTPVQIGESTVYDRPTLGIPRWKGYMYESDPNRFWAVYTNGGRTRNQLSYTTDGGETWSGNEIQVEPDGYLNMHASIFGRDGDLYATWPGREHVTFRKFDYPIQSNDNGGPLIGIGGTTTYHRSNIMVQDNGRIWLFTRRSYDDPAENILFNYSDNNGASWTKGTAYAANHNSVRFGSMPYVDGNPALIVLYLNDPRGFEYYLWDGDSFEAQPDHSIFPGNVGMDRAYTHNVIRDTTFHLVFGLKNELHHVWKNFNNGTGSWNHEIIDNSSTTDGMDWSPISTVRGDELYLFYTKKSTSSNSSSMVYEMKWSQETQSWTDPVVVSADGVNAYDRDPNTCFQVPENSPYIPVYWSRGNGPFDIYFAKVIVDDDGGGGTVTPVTIDCPSETIAFEECGAGEVCLPLEISDATEVVVDGGSWQNNTLCVNADTAGVYNPVITAMNDGDTAVCAVTVRVDFMADVTIDCPADTFEFTISDPATLTVDLPISNQTGVAVSGADWANDQLTFDADTAGLYSFTVTASNQCTETNCLVNAMVTVIPDPDLYLNDEDFTASITEVSAGENVLLSATVYNAAGSETVSNIVVRFYDGDPLSGGNAIGSDQTIASLDGGNSVTVQTEYMVEGSFPRNLYFVIDPGNLITESSETNNSAVLTITEAVSGSGTIDGTVVYDQTPLHGVTINLLDINDNVYRTGMTDIAGYYFFDEIPAGDYTVVAELPLGFEAAGESSVAITLSGSGEQVNFNLTDISSGNTTSYWWWESQIESIRSGSEMYNDLTRAHIDSFCARIFEHFYRRNDGFAVAIENVSYIGNPPAPLTFDELAEIWLDSDNSSNPAKTRKYLLSIMLDMVSERMSQMMVVSRDGSTASQAITYFAGRYSNGDSNDWTLWYYLSLVQRSSMIPSGIIPLTTPNIAFKSESGDSRGVLPSTFTLAQNHPNPFNPVTAIEFTIPEPMQVELKIYNVVGQMVEKIVSGHKPAGTYTVQWDASSYSSGIYFYRLTTEYESKVRKMVYLK